MDKLEVLKRAQMYVEKLANGESPLDDVPIEDNSILNNVRISRCLFYVNDILKSLIESGGETSELGLSGQRVDVPQKAAKPKKEPFVYDESRANRIHISPIPIALSVVARNISEAYPNVGKLSYYTLANMLKDKGVLIDNPSPETGTKMIASPHIKDNGIWSEEGTRQDGTKYVRTLYNEDGQRLVISCLPDLHKYM